MYMNYKRIYNKIIENRRINPLNENEYGEKHHVTPRSLGGEDTSDNLIRLSAKEHFICHALLAEMYEEGSNEWYKMNHAFMMMKCSTIHQQRYFNSRLYELKRKDFSTVMSESQSGKGNSQYGKVWMYHLDMEDTVKVSKSLIEEYEKLGYVRGRFNVHSVGSKYRNNHKLTHHERKLLEREREVTEHTTKDGVYFNKYRRNKIKEIFDIDLDDNFHANVDKLRYLLDTLYNEEKLSTIQIGNKFGKSDETIRLYLKLFKIKRRSLSESLKTYCNT
jgi:hypothetical protein